MADGRDGDGLAGGDGEFNGGNLRAARTKEKAEVVLLRSKCRPHFCRLDGRNAISIRWQDRLGLFFAVGVGDRAEDRRCLSCRRSQGSRAARELC